MKLERSHPQEIEGSVQVSRPRYFQEWRESGVDPEIIEANVVYLPGDSAIEFVAGDAIAASGSQIITNRHVTKKIGQILALHEFARKGGWAVTGLDPLNGFKRMDWGQFKPDHPRTDSDGKEIKYYSPYKVEARAILLEIPSKPNFWPEVLADPSRDIIIIEGAKKAGNLLSLGFPAIALPGVWMGGRWKQNGQPIKPHLIPEIAVFAQPGRRFVFVFDQDEKPKTIQGVSKAIERTGQLLTACDCPVSVATWEPQDGKGVDDLWANRGPDAVLEAIKSAQPLAQWKRTRPKPPAKGEISREEWQAKHGTQGFELTEAEKRDRQIQEREDAFRKYQDGYRNTFMIDADGTYKGSPHDVNYSGNCPTMDFINYRTILANGGIGSCKSTAANAGAKELFDHIDRNGIPGETVYNFSTRNGLLRGHVTNQTKIGIDAGFY